MTEAEIERLRRRVAALEAENARLRTAAGAVGDARDQRYRAIFESAVDFAIIAMDGDGRVTDWNTGAERIFGWSAEEMLGEPAERIFTPEDRSEGRPSIEMRCASEAGRAGDDRWHIRHDGSRFWARGEMMPLRDGDGAQIGYIKILRDRTEHERAVEALRVSEERLHVAQRAGSVGTFEWHPDAGKLDVSDEYRRIWGLAPGVEVTADLLVSLLHPDDRELSGPARLRLGENPLDYAEYRIIRPDTGEERWIARRGEVLAGDAPGARRFVGIAFDITERKLAEAALRENDARLRELLATLNLGTIMARGLDGTIRFWSDGCARLYGWAAGEAVGRNAHELLGTIFPVPLAEVEAALMRFGEWTGDLRHRTRNGREVIVTARKVLRRDAEGQPAAVLESLTDVTTQRRAEAEREAILGSIADGFVALDAEWRFTYVNAAAERLMEASKDDLLGRDHWALYPASLGTIAERELRRAMHERVPVSFENYYTPWGRWFDVRAYPALDGGITVYFQDITERKRTETALAESEAHFRATFEQAAVGVAHVGLNGRWLRVNARLCAMLGYTESELLARTFQETTHPDDLATNLAHIGQLVSGEAASVSFEKRYIRGDGGIVWAAIATMLRRDPGSGAPLHFISVFEDITERKRTEDALRASEEQLRLATDAAEIGLWDVDTVTDTLFWPPRVKAMFGISPEMPVSMADFYAGLHPDDRERASAAFAAALDPARRALYDVEYRTVGKEDGILRWVAAKGRGLFDANGTCLRVIGTAIDITSRKRAEDALRRQAEELQTLADNIPTLCWMAYADGHIYWYNRRWYDYTGTDPESQEGWGWESVHDPECLPEVVERWRHSIATGEKFEMTFPLRGADGVFRPFLTRIVPIRGEDGNVVRWFGTNTDITEQREAADALRLLTENLEVIVEERTHERDMVWRVSQDLFVICGFDGFYRSANPAWADALGYTSAELVGARFDDFVHPEDVPAAQREFERLIRGAVVRDFDIRVRAKDGSYRWYSWHCVPEDGEFYGAGRDITERKLLEEQLRQSQKMEAVGQLTGGLAHDFNNLLTGITGSLELMQARLSQGRTSDLERYILAAQGASRRAAALTHRLLAFSRRQTLDPKPTKVDGLIAGMEELIRRTVGPAVEIEVVGSAGLWTALVDPNQLESALLNLCINARDAMPDGGRLTIETANKWLDERAANERELAPGQYLSLCVTDTGTGMTPEVIQRAFDPFFTTKPIGVGTGLGLSMVYGFARQSGGQVRIYSELGHGTTMCLYLPRYLGQESDAAASTALAGAPRAEQGETVLVVDDEPTVRMLVTEVLETLGYIAIEATDGPAGLKVLESDMRIDLLITDVGLPGGMNGRQVADAGRAARPGLKVLFITGYAENAVVGNGHLEPGMQVLTKPFTIEALSNRIKDLIAER